MLEPDDSTAQDNPQPATTPPAADPADAPPAKTAAVKKAPAKKAAVKKAPAKKTAVKKAAAKEAVAEKAAAKDAVAKKAPAKKAVAKKAPAKKAAAKKAAAKEAAAEAEPGAAGGAVLPADGPVEEPVKKPARKRAAKKSAETVGESSASAADGAGSPPEMATAGVLFVPPAAQPPDTGRRAKKAAPAQSPAAGEPARGDVDLTAAEDLEDETAEPEDVREAAIEQASGARRRRRRGRRGRGGGGRAEDGAAGTDTAEAAEAGAATEATEEAAGEKATHRRRRRRRSGEADDASAGEQPNTITHVREPRAADDEVKAVKGSTRLEAKRQRRRDGRETTRRRAPILSEAEFLARREAVDRVMALRQNGDRTQIAVLEDGILVEHYVTRASATSYVGNVYLGRVQNVLPSMEAAFVDIGKGRNGVLYAGEVNWDAAGLEGKARAIETALKSGDTVLVQVTKDPIGHKGARLTSQVSLPGRFLVYVPGGGMTGISRRLPDTERHRLKSILNKIIPEDAGVIVRTAAEGASEEDLTRDVERLKAEWESIRAKAKDTKSAPMLLHGEPDLATRVVRDVFNEDVRSLVVQGGEAWQTVAEYISAVAPDLAERLSRHTKDTDVFHDLRVDEQLMKALDRKVWLPSGGSLVIDRTEAMTVIDVNTGKFVGAGGNLEQTVTRNNLEAAEEIVRQLRLRDVGGIVVIDFIDMVLESNRDLVLRRLTECLGRDRTKHQVAEVTSLGLVQLTRKRVGEGLLEAFSEPCEVCKGRGVIIQAEPVDKPLASRDEDRPAGKGKRQRGGRNDSAPEPELPAASQEQRKAASVAIAAIHRAAAGEEDEAGEPDHVVGLASDLVAAAAAADGTEPGEALAEEPAGQTPLPAEEPARPAALIGAGAGMPDAAPPAAEAPARRRRRVASRPAGPPGAA